MAISGIAVPPSAARLTESLRDVGYDFSAAIADLVDNSVMAGASKIDVTIEFCGERSRVFVADNGNGMTPSSLNEAMRFGSRRDYENGDLGRYGLGLKTASLSQGRSLTVVSRHSKPRAAIHARQIDLDLIQEFDEWLVVYPSNEYSVSKARDLLGKDQGTVVIWEKLDRILPEKNISGGWARRRFENLESKCAEHLSMVFHRFLDKNSPVMPISISVNGKRLKSWDPFALSEKMTRRLEPQRFEVSSDSVSAHVTFRGYILPSRNQFSSADEFDSTSGPMKWNRQQGIYIYRANRLVQWGGWAGIRSIDEHTKLGRASLDFDTNLDDAFNINVAKMRVSVPSQLKQMLERPVSELCILAEDSYRKASKNSEKSRNREQNSPDLASREIGLALKSMAIQSGEYDAFRKIMTLLNEKMPEVAKSIGL